MKALQQLPEGYREILAIDLQKDKRSALAVNLAGLAVTIVMFAAMQPFVSIATLFDMSRGLLPYTIRFLVLISGFAAYIILHELVHGITMKLCGTKRVRYGFTGIYAFAGSRDFYDKKSYLAIALAPILVWGAVLLILQFLVPQNYFWVVYFIQIGNVSGAAGDLYVAWKFSKLPRDILVQDYGVGMKVYAAE